MAEPALPPHGLIEDPAVSVASGETESGPRGSKAPGRGLVGVVVGVTAVMTLLVCDVVVLSGLTGRSAVLPSGLKDWLWAHLSVAYVGYGLLCAGCWLLGRRGQGQISGVIASTVFVTTWAAEIGHVVLRGPFTFFRDPTLGDYIFEALVLGSVIAVIAAGPLAAAGWLGSASSGSAPTPLHHAVGGPLGAYVGYLLWREFAEPVCPSWPGFICLPSYRPQALFGVDDPLWFALWCGLIGLFAQTLGVLLTRIRASHQRRAAR